MDIPTFCINLIRRPERKEFVKNQAASVGLVDIHFINAVDGENEQQMAIAQAGLKVNISCGLSKFEKACFLSHASIWAKMVADGTKLAVILEDDVCFVSSFVNNMKQLISEVHKLNKPFILYCGFVDPSTAKLEEVDLVTIDRISSTCPLHCYIVSLSAAKILLEQISEKTVDLAVDHFIFTKYDTLLLKKASRSICHQNYSFPSDIQAIHWTNIKLSSYIQNGFPKELTFS